MKKEGKGQGEGCTPGDRQATRVAQVKGTAGVVAGQGAVSSFPALGPTGVGRQW